MAASPWLVRGDGGLPDQSVLRGNGSGASLVNGDNVAHGLVADSDGGTRPIKPKRKRGDEGSSVDVVMKDLPKSLLLAGAGVQPRPTQ